MKEDAESVPRDLAERCVCSGRRLSSNSYFLFMESGVLTNPTGKGSQRRKPRPREACSGLTAALGLWAALWKPRAEPQG